MSGKDYLQHPGQNDLGGLSAALWHKCPRSAIEANPDFGWGFMDNLQRGVPTDVWTVTNATAGTFAMDTVFGSVALADSASTTATQGVQVQRTVSIFKPIAQADIYFEARVKAADIATGPEFALGLHNVDTTIIASSAVSTTDHVSFTSVTDDGILLGNGEKAGTGTTTAALHTFVDDTYVKLGFKITGVDKVEFFVNGVQAAPATNLATANIPIVVLVPSLVCQTGGTTDPIVHLDWMACYQHYRIAR